jgi:hypothetical protein
MALTLLRIFSLLLEIRYRSDFGVQSNKPEYFKSGECILVNPRRIFVGILVIFVF